MIVKLSISKVAKFGKLWTGNEVRRDEDQDRDQDDKIVIFENNESRWAWATRNIVDAEILELVCQCGRTTRKFKVLPVQQSSQVENALAPLPEVFVTGGGVGSICVEESVSGDVLVHNWSGRVGGHVILDPVMVLSGYYERGSLPLAQAGFGWVQTYGGSTFSEFVLLPVSCNGKLGLGIPVRSRKAECPPCRKRREEAAAEEAAAQLPKTLAESGFTLIRYWTAEKGIRYEAGCRDFTAEEALAHWGAADRKDDRARIFREAIEADLLQRKEVNK